MCCLICEIHIIKSHCKQFFGEINLKFFSAVPEWNKKNKARSKGFF